MADPLLKGLQNELLQLRAQLSDYENLYEVMEDLGESLSLDDVFEGAIRHCIRLCNADEGSVFLNDPSGQEEARTFIRNDEGDGTHLDHLLNMMMSGWVTRHETPLLTDEIGSVLGEQLSPERYAAVGSAISVPLGKANSPIGVVNLIRLNDKPAFSDREMRLMRVLGSLFFQYIHHARLRTDLFREAERLRKEVQEKYGDYHGIIGNSERIEHVFAVLDKVIPTDTRVLIQGESGTGKELVAKVIHYQGPRKDKPFIAVDCGALPANLLEGELFGYLKGAFTGANRDKQGLIEAANSGTLFLDEIANMPMEIQSKFLRAIQEGEIRPLGSTQSRKVDVRIIAAGNVNLKEKIEAGEFREDLYYRLNVIGVNLPPLRERKSDIALLANQFLKRIAAHHSRPLKGFKPEVIAHMEAYQWPGNVRELENIIERMIVLAEVDATHLTQDLLPWEIRPQGNTPSQMETIQQTSGIRNRKDEYEKSMLVEALAKSDWNQSAAARELGISERTVRYKMQKFGIEKPNR